MNKKNNKSKGKLEKQVQPMPGEVDPKNAKAHVFLNMQKVSCVLIAERSVVKAVCRSAEPPAGIRLIEC